MKNYRRKSKVILTIALLTFSMLGCDSSDIKNMAESASDIVVPPAPSEDEKIAISLENSDEVIASTIGSIEKLSTAIEDMPHVDTKYIPNLGSIDLGVLGGIEIQDSLDLCQEGGELELNSIDDNNIIVLFKDCQDKGIITNGVVKLSFNSGDYNLILKEFSYGDSTYFKYASIDYDERNEKKDFEAYISSGFTVIDGQKMELQDFTLNKNADKYTANGYISTGCIDGIAQIKTVSPLTILPYGCPSDGLLSIVGEASALSVTFNSNSSIDILYNNQEHKSYDSCLELPSYSDICQ